MKARFQFFLNSIAASKIPAQSEIKKQPGAQEKPMRLLQLLRSLCYKVIIIILLFEIFVKEARLDSLIVLVFSAVIAVRFP